MIWIYLAKLLREGPSEQRVENDDCFIQIPQKDSLKERGRGQMGSVTKALIRKPFS
jgi:hypothetical protein